MTLLSGLLDVFFRAFTFIGLALSVGGVVFFYAALRPTATSAQSWHRTAGLIAFGAFLAAPFQIGILIVAASALTDNTGWHIGIFLSTDFAHAGIVHATLAFCLGIIALILLYRPQSAVFWGLAAILAALVMISGAWLTHGASRLENATTLMIVTVIHQLAAITWIGGLMHLTAQWRLLRGSQRRTDPWPRIVARFSPLALGSVVVLIAAGIYLYSQYIGGARGLIGSAYGNMLISKIILMLGVLLLGGINNLTIGYWRRTGRKMNLYRRTPVFAKTEAGVGVIILMAAAALTGLPPAIDIRSLWVSPVEILRVFAPKIPQLTMPPYQEMLKGATSSLDMFALPTTLEKVQSNFNHNVSGILVIVLGLGALLNSIIKSRWSKNWPILFLPLAVFLVVIGEPTGWPLGKEPFFSTLLSPETLMHRLATLLVLIIGFLEWRVQTGALSTSRWRFVLPYLLIIGGALLLTHSHTIFAIKRSFLIEVSHNAIGILAVFAGAARWIELQLDGKEGQIASRIWPICFILIGIVLLFYRETL